MNILIIVPGGVDRSGSDRVIPALLALFRQLSRSHEVVIVATAQDYTLQEYSLMGCSVISLPKMKIRNVLFLRNLVLERLREQKFQPGIIHSFWLSLPTVLAWALSSYYHTQLLSSIGGGELTSIPNISYGGARSLKRRLLNRALLKLADHITVGSHFLKEVYQKDHKGCSDLSVVPLGIDRDFWPLRTPKPHAADVWGLLHLASINRVKNPALLLSVVQYLAQQEFSFHLSWIGEDTLAGEVQSKAREMGIDRHITFHGFKNQNQVRQIMKEQQFIVQTSLYESQGVAMAEAVSQGICPVGTRVGWLHDMEVGIDPNSERPVECICSEIIGFAADFKKRYNRVTRMQKWVKLNYSDTCANAFMHLYGRLLATQK